MTSFLIGFSVTEVGSCLVTEEANIGDDVGCFVLGGLASSAVLSFIK